MYFDARRTILAVTRSTTPLCCVPYVAEKTGTRQDGLGYAILRWLVLASAMVATAGPAQGDEPEADHYLLAPARHVGEVQAVRTLLEVQGELRWKPDKQDQPATAALKARGELSYDERLLDWDEAAELARSARHYHQAEAQIQVGRQTTQRKLPEDQRLLLNEVRDGRVKISSPAQPLTRDDLDLVDIHGNSLALHFLLPSDSVSVGDRWDIPEHALRALFGLDAVTENSVTGSLRSVADGLALIDLTGAFAGDVAGARTAITLQAKCNFDLQRGDVSWFTAMVREEREISDAQPGFQVTARLRVAVQPTTLPATLDDAVIEIFPPEIRAQSPFLRYVSSEGLFEMMLDPGWRTIIERTDVTVLRLFEEGQLVAQLLVSPLPDGPADKQLSLKSFEDEVRSGLAPHAGQIVETAEGTSDDGIRVIRVTAAGVVSEVSMQWVYYHVSEPLGRRVAMAFTVQTDLIETFAERDRGMVETLRFLPRSQEDNEERPEAGETPAAGSVDSNTLPTARTEESTAIR